MKNGAQTEWVRNELESGGEVTSWRAIQEVGATRLSGIIYNLKKQGMEISKEVVETTNRFGEKARIAKYYLV